MRLLEKLTGWPSAKAFNPLGPEWRSTLPRLLGAFKEARCAICLSPFQPAQPTAFCPDCFSGLKPLLKGCCPICGEIYAGGTEGICPGCQSQPPPWGKTWFHAAYAGTLRKAISRLKFNGDLHLAPALGGLLASHPKLLENCAAYNCVTPIPLHPSRLLKRGFNQSLEIARPLARTLDLPLSHLLERVNPTRHQAGLSRAERLRNVRGAFQAKPEACGKRVLLVDDIMTTGATLSVAAKELLSAGAACVDIAVIARTPARNMLKAIRKK